MTRQRERNLLRLENDLRRRRRRAKTGPDQTPVDPRTFVESAQYLNAKGELYPRVLEAFIELNSGSYEEAVLTGAIGTGKTTLAVFTMAYQLYQLSCLDSPQNEFGLIPTSEIVLIFQSLTEAHAQSVGFEQFRKLIKKAPFFAHRFPPTRATQSEIEFGKGIIVRALSGQPTAAIGQNVIGGVIDEVNFMQTVDRSTQSLDGRQYDQALSIYETLTRRRQSRFMKSAHLPGIVCLVSSRRYPNQFTDLKEHQAQKEIAKFGRSRIYIYDKRVWEIKPKGTYSDEIFSLFVGDETRVPRVLDPGQSIPIDDRDLVLQIPVDFRKDFEWDLDAALRDIAGLAIYSVRPYFVNREAVLSCFGRSKNILTREKCDFVSTNVNVEQTRFVKPGLKRWAHLDLSTTGDATGLVVGHISRFVQIGCGEALEMLPVIYVDLALQVLPPRNGEVQFDQIRKLLYGLRSQGLNICFVTSDSFQSFDTLQQLRRQRFRTGQRSPDREPQIYDVLKSTIYDGRLELPTNSVLRKELLSLERDTKTGKADHPVHGSKDVSDALATVVYSLSSCPNAWHEHGVSPWRQAPSLVNKLRLSAQTAKGQSRNEAGPVS